MKLKYQCLTVLFVLGCLFTPAYAQGSPTEDSQLLRALNERNSGSMDEYIEAIYNSCGELYVTDSIDSLSDEFRQAFNIAATYVEYQTRPHTHYACYSKPLEEFWLTVFKRLIEASEREPKCPVFTLPARDLIWARDLLEQALRYESSVACDKLISAQSHANRGFENENRDRSEANDNISRKELFYHIVAATSMAVLFLLDQYMELQY